MIGQSDTTGVPRCDEFERIAALPRRVYTEAQRESMAAEYTRVLRAPHGTMSLRPIQAVALHEARTHRGGLFPIRVGGGKTILSGLLPRVVLGPKRPLVLVPAALREKTRSEFRALRRHWNIPIGIIVESYERIGANPTVLETIRPDMIVADEAHKLKSTKAAVTKRIGFHMRDHPDTVFCAMSGTFFGRSLLEFAHLSAWALRGGSPLPTSFRRAFDWAGAIDVRTNATAPRVAPGALADFADGATDIDSLRAGLHRRISETPGVVSTIEAPLPTRIVIDVDTAPASPALERAFADLRANWQTPDGHELLDPLAVWRHARELAAGFYYAWDPRPPEAWLEARSAWASEVRNILTHNERRIVSEGQLRDMIMSGRYELPKHVGAALARWQATEQTFVPNVVVRWIDRAPVDRLIDAILNAPRPTLFWIEHGATAEALRASGIDPFMNHGLNSKGKRVETVNGSHSVALSIAANSTGRNLQKWTRNHFVHPPTRGSQWEQALGRTHRPGQEADQIDTVVSFDCAEHVRGFWQGMRDSHAAEKITGQAQKLCHSDVSRVPESIANGESRFDAKQQ